MTDKNGVEFDMVAQFPETTKTKSSSSSSSTNRASKKIPIPSGKRSSRLEMEVLLLSDKTLSITRVTFYSYDCPSDECEFNTTWSLNADAAYKTLESHIQWDHGREKGR